MICFAKPGLTLDLYTVQKREYSLTSSALYVHLTKAKRIHKRQPHFLFREDIALAAVVPLKEKSLVVNLKMPEPKSIWLAVNHQS
jgi:hypothetical protein